jgi:hypothetical protein
MSEISLLNIIVDKRVVKRTKKRLRKRKLVLRGKSRQKLTKN